MYNIIKSGRHIIRTDVMVDENWLLPPNNTGLMVGKKYNLIDAYSNWKIEVTSEADEDGRVQFKRVSDGRSNKQHGLSDRFGNAGRSPVVPRSNERVEE
jgi:hypothetical protein